MSRRVVRFSRKIITVYFIVYATYYCINHKKQLKNQFEHIKEYTIDLSYFNKKSKEEEILDNLNLPFKIKIEREKPASVKLPYWTPAIISAMKLLKKVSITDHSDQSNKGDKIIEELIRESPIKNKDSEKFHLNVPEDTF